MPSKKRAVSLQKRDRERVLVINTRLIRSVLLRLISTVLLIVAFVFLVHGIKEFTLTVFGVKFAEVLTDVLADRTFPKLE